MSGRERVNISGPQKLTNLLETLSRGILGKEHAIKQLITGLATGGHVLFEDVPGVGKTTLVKALARATGCSFKRIQCTPDLLPSDISGVSVYNHKTGEWNFQKGPVFTQILLADEINRTSPKTQSALLEAMQEKQVTADGITYPLEEPFLVIATQNPREYEGTYPLPESQLDRFTMRLSLGYPLPESEILLLKDLSREDLLERVKQVMVPGELVGIRKEIESVYVDSSLLEYITNLSAATREHENIALGISPRGSLHLIQCARARAYMEGRDYVLPDDIQELIYPVFGHRIILNQAVFFENVHVSPVLEEILSRVRVPGNVGDRW